MSAPAGAVAIGKESVGGGSPLLVIAGPCAAESERLCLEVGYALREACARAGVGYVFKASLDKANRTSLDTGRGPGMAGGIRLLEKVARELEVPVLTDIHEPAQASMLAEVCDCLQIPAFLCRQTDLLAAAARTGLPLHVKKGQFLAPDGAVALARKLRRQGAAGVLLCERGVSFGYHNLVVDMRSLVLMRASGCPVVFDATHSTQLPGAHGSSSGGSRWMALPLARAAVATGVDGLFFEAHTDPAAAVSDAETQLPLAAACDLLQFAAELHATVRARPDRGRPEDLLNG